MACKWRDKWQDILYVYNEGLGKANKRTSVTLTINWVIQRKFPYLGKEKFIKTIYLSYIRCDPNFVYSEESKKRKTLI